MLQAKELGQTGCFEKSQRTPGALHLEGPHRRGHGVEIRVCLPLQASVRRV